MGSGRPTPLTSHTHTHDGFVGGDNIIRKTYTYYYVCTYGMRERDRRGDVACVCTRTCERAYDILKSIDNLCHVPASVGARRTCMLVWPLKTITRSMRYRARVLVKRFTRRVYLLYYHYCNVTIVWHTVQKLMFIYFQCVHAVVGIGTTTYILYV